MAVGDYGITGHSHSEWFDSDVGSETNDLWLDLLDNPIARLHNLISEQNLKNASVSIVCMNSLQVFFIFKN